MILGMTTGLKATLTESNQVQNWSTTNIYRSEWTTIIFKRRYERCEGNCNLSNKHFETSTGFESTASALALQCSTNWAIKTHTLRAGQFVEFISTRERNGTWILRWCELQNYKFQSSFDRRSGNCNQSLFPKLVTYNNVSFYTISV